jgi:aspartyl-tRNA(Asn)/glutamyl-tRNA(Gln) amidotransferase subunit A
MDFKKLTISQIHDLYKSGDLKPVELLEEYLENVKVSQPLTNSFIDIFEDYALLRARELEKFLMEKQELPLLFGIPIGIKDNINFKGFPTTCASRILSGYKSLYNATVVEHILEEGGIIIGKLNMDEFAMGALGTYSFYGPVRNPNNPDYLAGGSSSGSASSVAAYEVHVSLGSDTGGSIRLPASYCGVYGLKPTYGRVSRYGLVAFASSLDQIGPFARNVEDLARTFVTVAGFDPKDSTSFQIEKPDLNDLLKPVNPQEIVLGYPDFIEEARMDGKVQKNFEETLSLLEKSGFRLKKLSMPHIKYSVEVYQIIAMSEASSNLSRYDGIRYGLRKREEPLENLYVKTRGEGFGEEVKRRIIVGTFALSHGYYDAYYLRALRVRRLIKEDIENAFKEVNLIISPVAPSLPPKLEENIDPVSAYYLDLFTIPANLAGIPAMAIPFGKSEENLPLGFQVMAPAWGEGLLFNFAYFFEKLTT